MVAGKRHQGTCFLLSEMSVNRVCSGPLQTRKGTRRIYIAIHPVSRYRSSKPEQPECPIPDTFPLKAVASQLSNGDKVKVARATCFRCVSAARSRTTGHVSVPPMPHARLSPHPQIDNNIHDDDDDRSSIPNPPTLHRSTDSHDTAINPTASPRPFPLPREPFIVTLALTVFVLRSNSDLKLITPDPIVPSPFHHTRQMVSTTPRPALLLSSR